MEKDLNDINDNSLDDLLKKTFLEEEDGHLTEKISKGVFEGEYDVKIDPDKERKVIKRFSGKGGFWGGRTFWIAGVSIIIVTVIIVIFVFNVKNKNFESKTVTKDSNNVTGNDTALIKNKNDSLLNYISLNDAGSRKIEVTPEVNNEISEIITVPELKPITEKKPVQVSRSGSKEVFELDPDIIIRYWYVKQMMMEKLIDNDKDLYEDVPEGNVVYKGEKTDVRSVNFRKCLVTNLEYRTFLIDLLVQGRVDEYEKAKVRSEIWLNYKMPELAETYFRSEKYNDFPVVNIPAFGASLFCEWLEKETKIYAKCIKKSYREFTLRIPSDAEWMNLVYYGITQIPPGDNFLTILDINEGYIDKALDKRIKSIQKSYKSKDIEDKLYATGRYGMSQEQVTEIFSNAWKLHETQPTDTIFPKRMKDFCLIGHVSEVITELNTGNNIVFGTIWKNKQEFSEMMNKYKSDGCSPFVGMRFVKLYEDAADYKNPFW